MSILVDENEWKGEEEFSFEPRDVKVRTDKWVTDEYEIYDILGRGKFGEVKKCKEVKTDKILAAKFISVPRAQDRKEVENEVEIMKRLQHPRLLQLYDAFQSKNEMCLILEIIQGGELFDRIIDDDFILTERACVLFMRQICEGMEYMHNNYIVHLDMKPENVLCLTREGNRIKIIDFGFAREFDPKKEMRVMFGTPEFMAPEIANYEPIGVKTDMWSVGVICYVLLSGLSPFMGDTDGETICNVTIGKFDFDYSEFEQISENAKDFIRKLLIPQRQKRMTSTEALQHPWLKDAYGDLQLNEHGFHVIAVQDADEKGKTATKDPDIPVPLLSKEHLKKFVFRRKWQKAVNAMLALRRMGVHLNNNKIAS